jgi:hypothetical protein
MTSRETNEFLDALESDYRSGRIGLGMVVAQAFSCGRRCAYDEVTAAALERETAAARMARMLAEIADNGGVAGPVDVVVLAALAELIARRP